MPSTTSPTEATKTAQEGENMKEVKFYALRSESDYAESLEALP